MSEISTAGWIHAYDAVEWAQMPTDGEHYLYVDGDFTAPAAAHEAFPQALTIAIEASTRADEFDFENGNPDHVVSWLIEQRAAGLPDVVYANPTDIATVLDQTTTAGIAPPYFRLAKWTTTEPATVPNYGKGTVGVQDADLGAYDRNLLSPDHPSLKRRQTPPTPAPEAEMKNYVTIYRIIDHEEVYGVNWATGKSWHIADTTALEAYIKLGVEQVTVPLEEYQAVAAV